MKSRTNISRYMKNAAAFESKTQLFSEDELRHLLENAPVSSPPVRVKSPTTTRRNIMIGSGILAGACAALVLYNSMQVQPAQPAQPISPAIVEHVGPAPTSASDAQVPPSAEQQNVTLNRQASADTRTDLRNDVKTLALVAPDEQHVPSRIKGLRALELQAEDLRALGINAVGEGYEVRALLGYTSQDPVALQAFNSNNGSRQTRIQFKQQQLNAALKNYGYGDQGSMKFVVRLDSFALRSTLQQQSTPDPEVAPLLITHECTDANGKENNAVLLFGNSDHNAAQHGTAADETAALYDLYAQNPNPRAQDLSHFPLLSKLVAVRLPLLNKQGVGADVVLWYYPSEAFINRLPKNVGDRIRTEIKGIDKAENATDSVATVPSIDPRERGEYRYTDVARAVSGGVEIQSIGPNPANDHATVRYNLQAERALSFVLYDMSGNRVALLAKSEAMSIGEHEETLDCHNLSSGAYLLSIVSSQGEQAIQRFIIQK